MFLSILVTSAFLLLRCWLLAEALTQRLPGSTLSQWSNESRYFRRQCSKTEFSTQMQMEVVNERPFISRASRRLLNNSNVPSHRRSTQRNEAALRGFGLVKEAKHVDGLPVYVTASISSSETASTGAETLERARVPKLGAPSQHASR